MSGTTQPKQPKLTTILTSICILGVVYVGLLYVPQAIAIATEKFTGTDYCRHPGIRELISLWLNLWIVLVVVITTLGSALAIHRAGLTAQWRSAVGRAGLVKGAMLLCLVGVAALGMGFGVGKSPDFDTVIAVYVMATGAVALIASGYIYAARRGQWWLWSAIIWVEGIAFGLVVYFGLLFALTCAK